MENSRYSERIATGKRPVRRPKITAYTDGVTFDAELFLADYFLWRTNRYRLEDWDGYCERCSVEVEPDLWTGELPERCPTCEKREQMIKEARAEAQARRRVRMAEADAEAAKKEQDKVADERRRWGRRKRRFSR